MATNRQAGDTAAGDTLASDDIAAYVDGTADPATLRRVVAAAVTDKTVRERVALLRAAEAAAEEPGPLPAGQTDRLRSRMLLAARAVADEEKARRALAAAGGGGGLWRVAAETWDALSRALDEVWRPLATGTHDLSLPCLAPAAAAPAASLSLHREAVTTGEGVRIEFQQLPGEAARLRLLVDASSLSGAAAAAPFDAALIAVEQEGGDGLDRHLLVVPLGAEGRGFTDFALGPGAAGDPRSMPASRALCRLTGATLTRLPARARS